MTYRLRRRWSLTQRYRQDKRHSRSGQFRPVHGSAGVPRDPLGDGAVAVLHCCTPARQRAGYIAVVGGGLDLRAACRNRTDDLFITRASSGAQRQHPPASWPAPTVLNGPAQSAPVRGGSHPVRHSLAGQERLDSLIRRPTLTPGLERLAVTGNLRTRLRRQLAISLVNCGNGAAAGSLGHAWTW